MNYASASEVTDTSDRDAIRPRSGRLFWRIWGAVFAAFVVVMFCMAFILNEARHFEQMREAQLRPWRIVEDLAIAAERFAQTGDQLSQWLAKEDTQRHGDVYLLNAQGEDVGGRILPQDIASGRLRDFQPPAISVTTQAASQSADGRSARTPSLRGLARAVYLPDDAALTLVFLPHNHIRALGPDFRMIPILLLLALLVTGVAAWLLARYLVRPVEYLHAASERIASGDFSHPIAPYLAGRNDELSSLAFRFDAMARKLGALLSNQQTLVRDMSHELRSPLARLRVALDLLTHNSHDDRLIVDRIDKEVLALDDMISDLLLLARLDRHESLVNDLVDMASLMTRLAEDASFEAQAKGVRVCTVTPQRPVYITGNTEQLRHAFENVIRNAIAVAPEDSEIRINLSLDANSVLVSVADAGPGVGEDECQLIFEPFYRSANHRNKRNGSGLGLAIAARITRAHQGAVSARNRRSRADAAEADSGLVIEFRFPATRADRILDAPARPAGRDRIAVPQVGVVPQSLLVLGLILAWPAAEAVDPQQFDSSVNVTTSTPQPAERAHREAKPRPPNRLRAERRYQVYEIVLDGPVGNAPVKPEEQKTKRFRFWPFGRSSPPGTAEVDPPPP